MLPGSGGEKHVPRPKGLMECNRNPDSAAWCQESHICEIDAGEKKKKAGLFKCWPPEKAGDSC